MFFDSILQGPLTPIRKYLFWPNSIGLNLQTWARFNAWVINAEFDLEKCA